MNNEVDTLSHDQVTLLMPAFIRGRLDTVRQRRVQEHIAGCPMCSFRHRRELELTQRIEQTPKNLEALLTTASRERNRQRLMADIDFRQAAGNVVPGNKRRLSGRGRHHALAAAIATLVIGAPMVMYYVAGSAEKLPVIYSTQTTSDSYQESVDDSERYRVVFRPGATLQNIQRLLLEVGAVVVGGPTEAGVYTLEFPDADSAESNVLSHLREQTDIVFAERSVHRDG